MKDLNNIVEAFEATQALRSGEIADYLPDEAHPQYVAFARELVRVDLEHSWKRNDPRALEDYRPEYPLLFLNEEAVKDLAYEEYRLRCQAGQNPDADDYASRYGIDTGSWPRPEPTQTNRDPNASLEALDRFLKEIQNCDRQDEQIKLVLKAVRESVGADAVFHFLGSSPPSVAVVGPSNLSTQWCREFAQETLQKPVIVGDHMLLPPLPVSRLPYGPAVQSAAAVRISRTTSAWVFALSFGSRRFDASDIKVMQLARRMLLAQRQYTQTYDKLKDALFSLIHCMTTMIDARDPYTCGHSERVARIAVRLSKQANLPARVQSDLYLAGLLHDVGKIGIRDEVLLKPGKLSAEEFAHIQEHVTIGDRIVSTIKQLEALRPGVRSHHERFDGKGYPDGLVGTQIPLMARILAIADSCDAMMSARPYRAAMPSHQIDKIMKEGAGTQWDPELIEHFMACRHDLYAICQRGLGQSVMQAVGQVLQPNGETSLLATNSQWGQTPTLLG